MGKNNLRRGQCHRPTLHRKAADLSLFQESLFASQPFNVTLPTSTTCSAFPALASAATALGSQKNALASHGSFQRAMGFTASAVVPSGTAGCNANASPYRRVE